MAVAARDAVGLSDIAHMLGVTKTSVARYAKRDDFPAPSVIARGRVWSRREIERWAKKTLPLTEGVPAHRKRP